MQDFFFSKKYKNIKNVIQFSTFSKFDTKDFDLQKDINLNKITDITKLKSIIKTNQVHGKNVFLLKKNNLTLAYKTEADAMITNIENIGLMVLTADCVPISLYDPKTISIGIIHAGWKGTKNNIANKTIKAMQKYFNLDPKNIVAIIGPSAGPCCYEVDKKMIKIFKEKYNHKCSAENKLDLWELNKNQLLDVGLKNENIEIQKICTICDNRFFSYRRQGKMAGRFGTIIALKKLEKSNNKSNYNN